MAIRQNIGIGGLYPTGRAPLAVDLYEPSRAITERMIKREQNRIEEEKTDIKENQKKILDAFSYEAVLGASEQMQLQHLHNVNSLIDEFADKWAAKGGKLSDKDQFELLKAKQKVNSERVNMQTSIKEMETVQGLLLKDPNAKIYSKESHQRFADAVNSGKAGNLDFDWLSILEPRKEDMFTVFADKEMGNYVKTMTENVDVGQITLNEDGTYSWGESNERILKQGFDDFFRSQRGQDIFRNYGGDTNAYQQMKGEFESILTRNIQKSDVDKGVYRDRMKGGEPVNDYYYRKYGWDTDKEQTENLVFFNDVAEGLLRADKNMIDSLTGVIDRGLGNLKDVQYETIDGEEFLVLIPSDKNKERQLIKLPVDRSDKTAVKNFKKTILDRFQSISGKQVDKNIMRYIVADWDEFTGSEPSMPLSLQILTKSLRQGAKEGDLGQFLETTIDDIKTKFPELEVDKGKGTKLVGKSKYWISITDPSVEGEQKTKEYDLRNATDRQELSDWIVQKSNYKEAMQDRWNPNAEEEQKEENIESMEKLVEAARQDAVSLAKKNNLKSLQEFKDFKLSIGLREEDIDRTIEQLGLTDEDFQ